MSLSPYDVRLTPCDIRKDTVGWCCDTCGATAGSPFRCKQGGHPVPKADADRYAALRAILDAAYEQAAIGKGSERHANGRAWTEQPIFTVTRRHGIGFLTGQAEKKLGEAMGMIARGEHERARAELLGAIVYAAAAAHVCGEGER